MIEIFFSAEKSPTKKITGLKKSRRRRNRLAGSAAGNTAALWGSSKSWSWGIITFKSPLILP
jgi:hypothetical protein